MGEIPRRGIGDISIGDAPNAGDVLGAGYGEEVEQRSSVCVDIRQPGPDATTGGDQSKGDSDLLLLHSSRVQVGAWEGQGSTAGIQPGSIVSDSRDGVWRCSGEIGVSSENNGDASGRPDHTRRPCLGEPGDAPVCPGQDHADAGDGHAVPSVALELGAEAQSLPAVPGTSGSTADGLLQRLDSSGAGSRRWSS